jgi:hypothetical protein
MISVYRFFGQYSIIGKGPVNAADDQFIRGAIGLRYRFEVTGIFLLLNQQRLVVILEHRRAGLSRQAKGQLQFRIVVIGHQIDSATLGVRWQAKRDTALDCVSGTDFSL